MSLARVNGLFTNAKDGELKNVGDTQILKMSLVSSEKYKDNEKTCFIEATAFGKKAEILHQWASAKGQQIFISGKLNMDKWEKDGVNHSKHTIIIEDFDFVRVPKGEREAAPKQTSPGVPIHYETITVNEDNFDVPF